MRNRVVHARGTLAILAGFVIAFVLIAGCGKKEPQRQPPASTSRQTATNAERQSTADTTVQPSGQSGQQPAQSPAGQPPATSEPNAETRSERPAAPGGAGSGEKPATPSGGGQQPASSTPAPSTPAPSTPAPNTPVPNEPPPAQQPPATPPQGSPAPTGNFKYVGVAACAMCHKGPSKGSIYETWLASDHAKAFENLGAENQGNRVCLACHTTGQGKPLAANVTPEKMVNVQCEACHGPGSEYKTLAVMKNRPEALKKGLVLPTREVCLGCHGGRFPEGHPETAFNYESALVKIEHHSKPTEPGK